MRKPSDKLIQTPHTLPTDLKKALCYNPRSLSTWKDITPLAQNEWICLIISAKKSETRKRRVERAISQLSDGKRRPCCWAGCTHK